MELVSFVEQAEAVKRNIDIHAIASQYTTLERSGNNYVGACPFCRAGNHPFAVSPKKNIFKCFSCGEVGDAIDLYTKAGGKTYGQTIKELYENLT